MDKMQTDEQPSTTGAATTEPAKPEAPKVQDVLKSALALVETAVKQKEGRLMSGRIMRLTASIRKQLTGDVLGALVSGALPADVEAKAFLLGYIEKVGACFLAWHRGRLQRALHEGFVGFQGSQRGPPGRAIGPQNQQQYIAGKGG